MGPVKSVKVVTDRDTVKQMLALWNGKQGRGQRALDEMNGKEYMGFRMVVKEAEERGGRPPRPGGGPGGGSGRPEGFFRPWRVHPRSGGSGGPGAGSGGFSSPDKSCQRRR